MEFCYESSNRKKKYKVVVENCDQFINSKEGKKIIEYSMHLIKLNELLKLNLITEDEYTKVKISLQKEI